MKISRRDFLYKAAVFSAGGLALIDGFSRVHNKNIESYLKNLETHRREIIHQIYCELPKHVHMAGTLDLNGNILGIACGIIVAGNYITAAHIIPDIKIDKRVTMLYDKILKEKVLDRDNDIAIFGLPLDLELEDFPAMPSSKYSLGDEVYIIGNPKLTGVNTRVAYISDLNGFDKYFSSDRDAELTKNCFGIDIGIIPGDSGSPVVNSKFELLGLTDLNPFKDYPILGYIKRIDQYLK